MADSVSGSGLAKTARRGGQTLAVSWDIESHRIASRTGLAESRGLLQDGGEGRGRGGGGGAPTTTVNVKPRGIPSILQKIPKYLIQAW